MTANEIDDLMLQLLDATESAAAVAVTASRGDLSDAVTVSWTEVEAETMADMGVVIYSRAEILVRVADLTNLSALEKDDSLDKAGATWVVDAPPQGIAGGWQRVTAVEAKYHELYAAGSRRGN